jgi:hypothetical protein
MNVYHFILVGVIYEILWLPMLIMLFLLPVVSMVFLFKEKFNIRSLYLHSVLIIGLVFLIYRFLK